MGSIRWPTGFERTAPSDRKMTSKFKRSLSKSFDDLEKELDRLGVGEDDYRYSFDAKQRQRDKRPYSRAQFDDPGFVLRWRMDGEDYAVACDRYTAFRDNVRAVVLYLSEKRKMENRPVVTGQSEFANARLPPARQEMWDSDPYELLGVTPDASEGVIRAAARQKKAETHPDRGGDDEEFKRVVKAEKSLLS